MGLKPVFGCRSAPGSAHAAASCLGILSEVHLIAISIAMTGSVQLNMTYCSGCRNAFVVDTLEKRIMDIRNNTGIDVSERVVLVKDGAGLQFEAEAYDRRGFFRAMKNMTFLGASGLMNETKDKPAPSYSKKMLPLKRDILNRTLRAASGKGISERLIMKYGFTLKTASSCDSCFSCIGICPTGALKSSRNDSGDRLMYNSSACIGCGLCRDFCPQHSIEILKGHKKESYFEYEVCNESLCRTDKTEEADCEDAVSV
jgi:Pyruvate/2-oxoacid:ferredoxin oxidoreductase delta subunit